MSVTRQVTDALIACGYAPEEAVAWTSRLPAPYLAAYEPGTLAEHLRIFASLRADAPLHCRITSLGRQTAALELFVPDYAGMLATIAGTLTGAGIDIMGGDTYTLAAVPPQPDARASTRTRISRLRTEAPFTRRKLVFGALTVTVPGTREDFAATLMPLVEKRLRQLIFLREAGQRDEARAALNQDVATRLAQGQRGEQTVLMPVELDIDADSDASFIRLAIVGQDTPAFLYAIANALSLRAFYIERVHIETRGNTACDTFWITDDNGRKPEGQERMRELRIAALLTKQFTHFLGNAPDPYKALSHFDQLLDRILADPDAEPLAAFRHPETMARLARLLGASDFLWEDFIRLQYESILPALAQANTYEPVAARFPRLDAELGRLSSFDERIAAVNRFKDLETARADMAHILQPDFGYSRLGDELSEIADGVIRRVAAQAWERLTGSHGAPRTVGGAPCPYAVFGLGKLGGQELGYASDLELLLVYSDMGRTAGPEAIENAEFFNRMVELLRDHIFSTRDGIYEIDLRLRPHGTAGPLAASMESMLAYYAAGGAALDYERLALTRLRPICGDMPFAAQVIGLRDDLLFHTRAIDFDAVKELRIRQHEQKGAGTRLNAKFSAGGLVDIEYAVQMLQVIHGGEHPSARQTGILHTLEALEASGSLSTADLYALRDAYRFLRSLINALRMLRGHARDLEIPPAQELEFAHLARRMGYGAAGGYDAAQRLMADIERHMAVTRAFYRTRFGEGARPGRAQANLADIVLSDDPPQDICAAVFERLGLVNHTRALANIRALAGHDAERTCFARLAVLLRNVLPVSPSPDMALNNVAHFAEAVTSRLALYQLLMEQPRKLELLFRISGASNYLSHTLRRTPELFDWLTAPETLARPRVPEAFAAELAADLRPLRKKESHLRMLRRFRNRETLRIGVRDLCLGAPFTETVAELSHLADTLIQASLDLEAQSLRDANACPVAPDPGRFVVFAFGKLGGRELNYSSDIDLAVVYDAPAPDPDLETAYTRLTEGLIANLDRNIEEGYVYRLDMRLRPHGHTAPLVIHSAGWEAYYAREAALWELQALLKVRPVAGCLALGERLLDAARLRLHEPADRAAIAVATDYLRNTVLHQLARSQSAHASRRGFEIKNGPGGIRDIEFGIQALQRIHAPVTPDVLAGATLDAIARLRGHAILTQDESDRLAGDYVFLRRIEHILQILDDQQLHILRDTPQTLAPVAALMPERLSTEAFRTELEAVLARNRAFFLAVMAG